MTEEKQQITVLMPVYNGERYLKEAIDSILTQTYRNFDLLIINDGSTDNSENIIKKYNDPRIKYLKNLKNLGIVETLNIGLSHIKTKYVARMDCDDISTPTRIEKQFHYMENNKNIAIAGTWISYIGKEKEINFPCSINYIKSKMLLGNQLAHPAVIIRKDILDKYKLRYSKDYKYANDYDLWIRFIMKGLLISNIPEVMIYYRIHPSQMGETYTNREQETIEIQKKYLSFIISNYKFLNPIYLINILKYIKNYIFKK